jgi:hypothetical protein
MCFTFTCIRVQSLNSAETDDEDESEGKFSFNYVFKKFIHIPNTSDGVFGAHTANNHLIMIVQKA